MSRARLFFTLRFVLAAGILFLLLKSIDPGHLVGVLRHSVTGRGWLLAGVGFTFLGLGAGVVRWHDILRAQGLHLPVHRVFKVFFIGQFFNAFMPGACGGDVTRAVYVARAFPGRRAEAASTVLVDRGIGLFATIVFACALLLVRLPFILDRAETEWPGLLMVLFLVASVGGLVALFRRNLFEHWASFRRLEESTRLGPLIRRAYEAFYLYRRHPRVVARALLYSMLNLCLLTLACMSFGRSLPIHVSALDYFTFFPVITALAAIPLTPGALGLREGLFATLFSAVGVGATDAVTLSLLVYGGGLVCSLLGGIYFVGYTAREHHSLREELRVLRRAGEEDATAEAARPG